MSKKVFISYFNNIIKINRIGSFNYIILNPIQKSISAITSIDSKTFNYEGIELNFIKLISRPLSFLELSREDQIRSLNSQSILQSKVIKEILSRFLNDDKDLVLISHSKKFLELFEIYARLFKAHGFESLDIFQFQETLF